MTGASRARPGAPLEGRCARGPGGGGGGGGGGGAVCRVFKNRTYYLQGKLFVFSIQKLSNLLSFGQRKNNKKRKKKEKKKNMLYRS